MRYAYGLLLALACACGGGGTPAITNGSNGGTTSPAQQILEGCGVDSIDDFLGVLEIIEGLLDPNETNPAPIVVLDVDPVTASANWNLDLDADMTPDLMGSLHFTNDQGEPETGADVNQLAGGLDDLDAFITSLPDGTNLTVIAAAAVPPPFDIGLTFIINGGVVDTVSGTATAPAPECQAAFDFQDALFQGIGGAYPSLVMNVMFVATDGSVEGTLTLNGTNQATAEVTLDGAPEILTYIVNLDTGAVTRVS
jgi:hypothetical protein